MLKKMHEFKILEERKAMKHNNNNERLAKGHQRFVRIVVVVNLMREQSLTMLRNL